MEVFDFEAFKKKKEEKELAKEKALHKDAVGEPPKESVGFKDSSGKMNWISPERMSLIAEFKNSYKMSPTTRATVEDYFKNSTREELIDFINNSNIPNLRSRPTYLIVAFEKLMRMVLSK